ncbi:hypothetical protein HCUR_00475 [Holospora curviuscula]|uniref:Uncharacterized protein n=1 Tax=Holospora curviuscula TaxID=1082868 RepID=A0A2S5RAC4_9PROT|nr:hypothetical protein HCUR_00475 [Holospora curviuscula]
MRSYPDRLNLLDYSFLLPPSFTILPSFIREHKFLDTEKNFPQNGYTGFSYTLYFFSIVLSWNNRSNIVVC